VFWNTFCSTICHAQMNVAKQVGATILTGDAQTGNEPRADTGVGVSETRPWVVMLDVLERLGLVTREH
jgi:hypothetical protein